MSRKQWWINWNGVNTCFIRLLIILINSGNPMFPDPVASASANISSSCSEETNTPTTIGKYQQSFIYPRKSKRSEGFVMVHWRMWGELDVEKYLPILWLHLKMKHIMDVWWVIKWLMHDWWLEMNCKCPKILIGRYCRRKKHLPTPIIINIIMQPIPNINWIGKYQIALVCSLEYLSWVLRPWQYQTARKPPSAPQLDRRPIQRWIPLLPSLSSLPIFTNNKKKR